MKKTINLFLFVLITLSCSNDDDNQEETQLCDCDKITLVYQGDNVNTEIIGEIIETVFQIDCNTEDETYFTENGNLVTEDYTCD